MSRYFTLMFKNSQAVIIAPYYYYVIGLSKWLKSSFDADMKWNTLRLQPSHPFAANKLPVCYDSRYALPAKEPDEAFDQVYSLCCISIALQIKLKLLPDYSPKFVWCD